MYNYNKRKLINGEWIKINSQAEFNQILDKSNADEAEGAFEEPGNYFKLNFQQSGPCNLIDVCELLTEDSAKWQIEREIKEEKEKWEKKDQKLRSLLEN